MSDDGKMPLPNLDSDVNARDDRDVDVLGLQALHQVADIDAYVDHQQVGAAAGAEHPERLLDVLRVGDGRALVDSKLGRLRELAFQGADDQKSHGSKSFV